MTKIPFTKDLNNFCQHAKINQPLQDYIKNLLAKISQELQVLEEEWFTYWPEDYSNTEGSFLEFSWIPTKKTLGFQFDPNIHWLEGYRHSSDPETHKQTIAEAGKDREKTHEFLIKLNKLGEEIQKPKEVKEFTINSNEENYPCLQISFHQNISPEPWEEGSSGYKD